MTTIADLEKSASYKVPLATYPYDPTALKNTQLPLGSLEWETDWKIKLLPKVYSPQQVTQSRLLRRTKQFCGHCPQDLIIYTDLKNKFFMDFRDA